MVSDFVEIVSNPCGLSSLSNLKNIKYAKFFFKRSGFDTFYSVLVKHRKTLTMSDFSKFFVKNLLHQVYVILE